MICKNSEIEFDEGGSYEAMSLLELNTFVRDAINDALPDTYWVRAETSDVRVNASSGHCYMEFVEKDEHSGQTLAKARGMIWAQTFQMLKPYFEDATGRPLASGLKVLVNVSVEFHELYGFSLTVHDIDPSYTLGDMVKKRLEIIHRLQEEGIFEMNKELEMPLLPQRIAVITSPTAAGYEDFVHQITENEYGFPFYLKLFPALMQGEKTESSVLMALDKIYKYRELFDVVVIIRGGGSATDLSSFDTYDLASNCAQFPLPIITGIGHERDDSVVDMVAHTRMKTPTAVAAFLIDTMAEQADEVEALRRSVCSGADDLLRQEKTLLQSLAARFPTFVTGNIEHHRTQLHGLAVRLSNVPQRLEASEERLNDIPRQLLKAVRIMLLHRTHDVELNEQYVRMASPDYILKRGYTLTYKDGEIVKKAGRLLSGDDIVIRFADGEKSGKVK